MNEHDVDQFADDEDDAQARTERTVSAKGCSMTVMNRVRLVDDLRRTIMTTSATDVRNASERELYLVIRRMVYGILAAFDRHYGVR